MAEVTSPRLPGGIAYTNDNRIVRRVGRVCDRCMHLSSYDGFCITGPLMLPRSSGCLLGQFPGPRPQLSPLALITPGPAVVMAGESIQASLVVQRAGQFLLQAASNTRPPVLLTKSASTMLPLSVSFCGRRRYQ
jgi:hypothetical protein